MCVRIWLRRRVAWLLGSAGSDNHRWKPVAILRSSYGFAKFLNNWAPPPSTGPRPKSVTCVHRNLVTWFFGQIWCWLQKIVRVTIHVLSINTISGLLAMYRAGLERWPYFSEYNVTCFWNGSREFRLGRSSPPEGLLWSINFTSSLKQQAQLLSASLDGPIWSCFCLYVVFSFLWIPILEISKEDYRTRWQYISQAVSLFGSIALVLG